MPKILETVIVDKKKAWEGNLSNKDFLVDLDATVINELVQKRNLLKQHKIQDFPCLKLRMYNFLPLTKSCPYKFNIRVLR